MVQREYGSYDTYKVTAPDGRGWKLVSDSSINCQKREKNGKLVATADKAYNVELVTPILTYREDIDTLQTIVRALRRAGGATNESCGQHIHLDGAPHGVRSIQNFINIIASKNDLMKSLGVGNLDFHEEMDNDGKPIVAFYWMPKGTPGDLFMAALEMVSHLCRKALEMRNIDPTEYPATDEQFEFSRFLHRIGMVGAAYKKQRKILMRNLSGSTWRKAVEERTARRALEGLEKGA